MFKINDMVVYGTQGVCKIIDIEEKDLTGTKKKYLVLKPLNNENSTYFAPMDNEKILARIRKLLSKKEINELIDSMPNEDANWISNENERKEKYRSIISEGKHTELIKVIKAIYFEKKQREANKKRLTASDDCFLRDAEKFLHGEFRYVLNLNENELIDYIFNRIEKNGNKDHSLNSK